MEFVESAEEIGLNAARWQTATQLLEAWCRSGEIPSASLVVGRSGKTLKPCYFGRQTLDENSPPLRDDAIFLIASITKPIVGLGALLLIERGLLTLGDRVIEYLPEFGRNGKSGITIRHLLTHTSGLPDMLPNNQQLRIAQSPLSVFVEDTCEIAPAFTPGRNVQYQSMGLAILGEVIARIAGCSCAEFLQRELFAPLQMHDTVLGTPDDWYQGEAPRVERIAEIRTPPEQESATHWGWNSRYWRSLGAPWGGLLTTPADLAAIARLMLNHGRVDGQSLLSPAAIAAATRNQLEHMPSVPADEMRKRPWGLGWRLNWPAHSANFGDLLGPRTFGHWGATGTLLWIDPDRDIFAAILTTRPQEPRGRYLARLSNAIMAAIR